MITGTLSRNPFSIAGISSSGLLIRTPLQCIACASKTKSGFVKSTQASLPYCASSS